jgi:hypothetical protein
VNPVHRVPGFGHCAPPCGIWFTQRRTESSAGLFVSMFQVRPQPPGRPSVSSSLTSAPFPPLELKPLQATPPFPGAQPHWAKSPQPLTCIHSRKSEAYTGASPPRKEALAPSIATAARKKEEKRVIITVLCNVAPTRDSTTITSALAEVIQTSDLMLAAPT